MSSHEIELTDKIVPDAYHGTSQEIGEIIIREQRFKRSSGENNYLGDGIYFYEAAKSFAEEWARKRFPDKQIAVVRAIIGLGRCLDLHIPEHVHLVQIYAEKLKTEVARRAAGPASPSRPITDSFVINFIAFLVQLDTVRAGRTPLKYAKSKIFEGSRWRNRQEIMICVRNPKSILNVRMA